MVYIGCCMGFTQLIRGVRAGFATMNMCGEVNISGWWNLVWNWKWWV